MNSKKMIAIDIPVPKNNSTSPEILFPQELFPQELIPFESQRYRN